MKQGNRIAILGGLRTPFAKAGTALKDTEADDLAVRVITEVLARSPIEADAIDEVVLGCVGQPSTAMNIARVSALRAGLPHHVPAVTVHRNCASSMESLTYAKDRIDAGRGTVFLVGGTESMSQAPLHFGKPMTEFFGRLARAKTPFQRLGTLSGFRPGFLKPRISLLDGLSDKTCGLIMGMTAENVAHDFDLSREQQDQYALESHQKAERAQQTGRLDRETVPIIPAPHYREAFEKDNGIRAGQTLGALAKLRPFFDKKHGTVTVGNACPVTDGAVALMVTSEERAKAEGWDVLGYLSHYAYAGLDPSRMGLGPVFAMNRIFEDLQQRPTDFDLIEINEAFAAQVLGCVRAAESASFSREHFGRDEPLGAIDPERLNVNGGAIALGHPVGATGGRLVLTMLHELRERSLQRGLATLCVGGGLGAALVLERE